MRKSLILFAASAFVLMASCKKENPKIEIQTYKGSIIVELDQDNAPKTTRYFLSLLKDGIYDSGAFYRSGRGKRTEENPVRVKILQGGVKHKPQKPDLESVPIENTDETGLKHDYLTFSLIKENDKPSTEFLICMDPQPELDKGGALNPDGENYIPFGRVVAGEEIVQKVWGSPAIEELIDPLIIIHTIKIRK
jgi:peptidyl-prolyl cis-trans isomerase A (cyclophilin A)